MMLSYSGCVATVLVPLAHDRSMHAPHWS